MTNLEKWNYYLKDATSPQSYIDMSFYFMISAALQRRVWFGSYEQPLFPNIYAVLVGDPGTGKGLVIRPVNDILKSFKFRTPNMVETTQIADGIGLLKESAKSTVDQSTLIDLEAMLKNAPADQAIKPTAPLFHLPCTADSTTYESLVHEQATAYRKLSVGYKDKFSPNGIYTHSSMYMLLEEMGSLFRKQHETLIRYLIVAFDCGDYHYKTKHQGEDYVKKCCLSILAGCTPTFMAESFSARVIDEGFSSRALYVYANAPRFDRWEMSKRDESQLMAFEDIKCHVERLIKLYGNIKYTPEANEFMKNYVEHIIPAQRAVIDPKLIPYFARKKVHIMKMTAVIHFADSLSLEVSLDSCKKAVEYLDKIEKSMYYALQLRGKNPLKRDAIMILEYIKKQSVPQTKKMLWIKFVDVLAEKEFVECMKFLVTTGAIKIDSISGVVTPRNVDTTAITA